MLTILAGSGLLMLPAFHTQPPAFVDSLFTATSAMTVTGLATLDTPRQWTFAGQLVILGLIQIGGLGVLTFAALIGRALFQQSRYWSRVVVASELNLPNLGDFRQTVLKVAKVFFVVEAAVALILFLRFWLTYKYDVGQALWLGIFHAVSSFNNAGFALFSDNLMGFVTDPVISLTISFSLIIGGLGLPVWAVVLGAERKASQWSLTAKLVLAWTPVLLLIGWAAVAILEWSNPATLGGLSVGDKLLASFTQAAQVRTAGFNNLNIGAMDPLTWLVMDVLMFIGGGPAGTAGGIKITTFSILLLVIFAELRGNRDVNAFGRRITSEVQRQAITVALLSVALVVGASVILMLITDFHLEALLFETISAFGTVGLSTGITPILPDPAKVILTVVMLIGRLGPISFALALAINERPTHYRYPTERPIIG